MKKVLSIVFILLLFFGSSYASFKDSLKQHLEKNNIEDGSTQIYLLNRCSAVYTYASAILLETDKLNSKNNNLIKSFYANTNYSFSFKDIKNFKKFKKVLFTTSN